MAADDKRASFTFADSRMSVLKALIVAAVLAAILTAVMPDEQPASRIVLETGEAVAQMTQPALPRSL